MYDRIAANAVAEIAEMRRMLDEYQKECADCFALAQRLDADNPELVGAFSGTPSERIKRQLVARGVAEKAPASSGLSASSR